MTTYTDVLTVNDNIIKSWTNVKMSTIINYFFKFKFLQQN